MKDIQSGTTILCGPLERLFFAKAYQSDGDGYMGSAALRVRGLFDLDRLQIALEAVQKRHPKLRGRFLIDERGRLALHVHELPLPCPIEVVDRAVDTPDWDAELTRDIGIGYDQMRDPLWRVRVVQDRAAQASELILISHHSLFDGKSIGVWFHDVLSYYAGDRPVTEIEPLPVRMSARLTPTPDHITSIKLLVSLLVMVLKKVIRPQRVPPAPVPEPPECRTRLEIAGAALSAFQDLQAKEDTSLPGLASAAGLLATLHALGLKSATIFCAVPLDVRRLMSPRVSDQDIGCFTGMFFRTLDVTAGDNLFGLARRIRLQIMESLHRREPAWVALLLDRVALRRLLRKQKPSWGRPIVVAVSHFGKFSLNPAYGEIVPERMWLSIHGDTDGPSLGIFAVQLGSVLCLTARPCRMTVEVGAECVRRFRELLGVEEAHHRNGETAKANIAAKAETPTTRLTLPGAA